MYFASVLLALAATLPQNVPAPATPTTSVPVAQTAPVHPCGPDNTLPVVALDTTTVYVWKDHRGVRHYTDDQKQAPSNAQTKVVCTTRPLVPSTAADPRLEKPNKKSSEKEPSDNMAENPL